MNLIKRFILKKYFKFDPGKYIFIEEIYHKLLKMDKQFFERRELVLDKDIPSFGNPTLYCVDLIRYISGKIDLPSQCEVIPSFVSKESSAGTIELTSNNIYKE